VSEWSKFTVPPIKVDRRPDGTIYLQADEPLGDYARCIGDVLLDHARTIPDRVQMAQRDRSGAWRKVTYAESARIARNIGQALLDRKLNQERPIVIVAENTVDHALLHLGAVMVGVPFAPVSAAYARPGQGFSKLKYILDLIKPGLIFVDTWARYSGAREALDAARVDLVFADDVPADAKVTP
jgi:feruloyl-CoA synthase